jgi:uncharacterized membrane protein YraQ (UPF0718 family)
MEGVPLAPVMSFRVASPSTDAEAFFLSVAAIGEQLSIWRMVATLILSFCTGMITDILTQRTIRLSKIFCHEHWQPRLA